MVARIDIQCERLACNRREFGPRHDFDFVCG